jgi:hypothetical protein
MKLLIFTLALVNLLPPALAGLVQPRATPFSTFNSTVLYSPPSSYKIPRTLYARSVLLNQNHETTNVILATWENYSQEPPYFPIYRSADGGETWSHLTNVRDSVNGWGLRYQPFLYELPQAIGSFPAGTILLAGNSIPSDLSKTKIDVYASTNQGQSFQFVSTVASGGVAQPNNGETPVWEPFFLVWQNQIVIYYSDQRDPKHGQKMVHQVSSDLKTWGSVVDDFASPTYHHRPGMTTIAQLPNGQYILTYEFYGAPEASFAVYYRLSSDPTKFSSATGRVIKTTNGKIPTGSPYVVWTPAGGQNGTIVVSSGCCSPVYTNTALGAPGSPWTEVKTPEGTSYTRSLRVMPNNKHIMLLGGGVLNGSNNKVTVTVMQIAS